jgi:hypothetical protein
VVKLIGIKKKYAKKKNKQKLIYYYFLICNYLFLRPINKVLTVYFRKRQQTIKMADNSGMDIDYCPETEAHVEYFNLLRDCLERLHEIVVFTKSIEQAGLVRSNAYAGYEGVHDYLGYKLDGIWTLIKCRRGNMSAELYEQVSASLIEVISKIREADIPLSIQSEILENLDYHFDLY